MKKLSSIFNSEFVEEVAINRKNNYTLSNSSFLKFLVNGNLPDYIIKFIPADRVGVYLYFSSEFKSNMYFLVVRINTEKGNSIYRLLALSSFLNEESEINFVVEYERKKDEFLFKEDSFDNFFESILESYRAKYAKLIFHKFIPNSNLSVKLNLFLLKEAIDFILLPSLYDWLHYDYVRYGNKPVVGDSIGNTVYGYSKEMSTSFLCGLNNLGNDISRIRKLDGIVENEHYFFYGDIDFFGKRTTYNFKGAIMPDPNSPKLIRFTFGFSYYQGDNPRDGQVTFELSLSKINHIHQKIKLEEERIKKINDSGDLPF